MESSTKGNSLCDVEISKSCKHSVVSEPISLTLVRNAQQSRWLN